MNKKNPYLSIVVSSRNDNHGGNMLERMQMSFNGLFEQLEKYALDSELILVDWNSPEGKPPLRKIIKWPNNLKYCAVRIIEVSSVIHRRYEHSDKVPINVAVSLNCGIRRAKGDFILSGTIDLLYPDELIYYIALKKLKNNERYRTDRYDVNRDILRLKNKNLKEQLDYCAKNIIQIHGYETKERPGLPNLHTDACGDFQLMSKNFWHFLRGYREADLGLSYIDGLLSYASFSAGAKEVVLKNPLRVYHIDHNEKCNDRLKTFRPVSERLLYPFFRLIKDFVPKSAGKKMVSLHHKLWGKKNRSEAYGVPTLDYLEYLKLSREMVEGKRPYIFNNEDWGLGKENLSEFII